ncbi:hypothetical protein OEZ85_002351 [Tetradesmus obliquus]|uniref:RNI-like protein n=1 Tax=Tetradesmus obliquus TaxID=3088 RepID=A0ABY8U2X8_TETOB|nr:hypothetical protein OEZ85_002351 [Tetradesmus obliquus]
MAPAAAPETPEQALTIALDHWGTLRTWRALYGTNKQLNGLLAQRARHITFRTLADAIGVLSRPPWIVNAQQRGSVLVVGRPLHSSAAAAAAAAAAGSSDLIVVCEQTVSRHSIRPLPGIASLLPELHALHLKLSGVTCSIAPMRCIAAAAASWPQLHTLSLDNLEHGKGVNAAAVQQLQQAMASWKNLKQLGLRIGMMSVHRSAIIRTARESCQQLQVLKLRFSWAASPSVDDICGSWPQLKTLDIGDNCFGDVAGLAAAVASCPLLEELDMSGNIIGDDGATQIAAAVASCPLLKKLGLGNNSIGDAGVAQLATAVAASCPLLERLDLRHNRIGTAGMTQLATALPNVYTGLRDLRRIIGLLDMVRLTDDADIAMPLVVGKLRPYVDGLVLAVSSLDPVA